MKEKIKLEYTEIICNFTLDDLRNKNIKINKETLIEENTDVKRLWAMFGIVNNKSYCIQVGSSKNIYSEIKAILKSMVSEPQKIMKSTEFHKDVYEFQTYMDKESVKYRSIASKYNNFEIYEIKIGDYLKGCDIGDYDKVNYSEVKFAFENKALLWNPAPQTNNNKEKEILKLLRDNSI